MYKKFRVNIMESSKEYFKMLRRMFPEQEEGKEYFTMLRKRYSKEEADKEYTNELREMIFGEEEFEEKDLEIFDGIIKKEIEDLENTSKEKKDDKAPIKTISTARTIEEINKAVEKGYKPLIKEVITSDKIKVMYALERDLKTGRVRVLEDSYEIYAHHEDAERVIDEMYYYPYQFPSPFAAYLVPIDIVVGERVILEDLIEDIVGASHKMHTYRLASAEAIWAGEKFIIDHESYNVHVTIG